MAKSFFEKLKKGMGIELPIEEELEEEEEKEEKMQVREIEIENEDDDDEEEEKIVRKTSKKKLKKKIAHRKLKPKINKKEILKTKEIDPDAPEQKEDWLVSEGQLSIDVYQTKDELVIQSAIAGIKSESLDIALEGDVITIKGSRKKPIEEEADYFTQECHWGKFSREIILPVETDPNLAKASMKEGILTIRIPKIFREKKRKISVKELSN